MKTELEKDEITKQNLKKFFKDNFKYTFHSNTVWFYMITIQRLSFSFTTTDLTISTMDWNFEIKLDLELLEKVFINKTEDGELYLQINASNGLIIMLDENSVEFKDEVRKALNEQ